MFACSAWTKNIYDNPSLDCWPVRVKEENCDPETQYIDLTDDENEFSAFFGVTELRDMVVFMKEFIADVLGLSENTKIRFTQEDARKLNRFILTGSL